MDPVCPVDSLYPLYHRGSTIFDWLQHKGMVFNKHHVATDYVTIDLNN